MREENDDGVLDLSDDELLALPRPPCPQCGVTGQLMPRVYRMHTAEDLLLERAQQGEVVVEFAGCIVPGRPTPVWRCRQCCALVARDGSSVEVE